MNNKIDNVISYRKKIFDCNKFEIYNSILNKMQIPEQFDYKNCIPKVFAYKSYKNNICKFKIDPYKKLYKATCNYVREYQLNKKLKNLLVVHPFYPIIRHANFLIEDYEYFEKYKNYEKEIIKLFSDLNYNIILLESPDNFARYTYQFYDKYKFNKVIFTEHSTGKILKNDDLNYLKKLDNFESVGCYGDNCIKDVEDQLKNKKIVRNDKLIMERAK